MEKKTLINQKNVPHFFALKKLEINKSDHPKLSLILTLLLL